MLGTTLSLTAIRLLHSASRMPQDMFENKRVDILKKDLLSTLKRIGNIELYKHYKSEIDAVTNLTEYQKVVANMEQTFRKANVEEEKIRNFLTYTQRMQNLKQTDCEKMYQELGNFDIITSDKLAKMNAIVQTFDAESLEAVPLFQKNGENVYETYTDAQGVKRVKLNPQALNFTEFNKVAKFAKDHNKKIHINTIMWHLSVPKQIQNLAESKLPPKEKKRLAEDFLYGYMQAFVENAKNNDISLQSVEIFNEIAADTSSSKKNGFLRTSIWRDLLGDDYYIKALQMAKSIFPKETKLFYNDYGEFQPQKKQNIQKVIKRIQKVEKEQGVCLLDGIGLQCHLYGQEFPFSKNIKEYCTLAGQGVFPKEVRITELDSANCDNPTWQQEQMRQVVQGAEENGIENLTYWSAFEPFIDHLENTSHAGLISAKGNQRPLLKESVEQFKSKEPQEALNNSSQTERTMYFSHNG